MLAPFLKFSSSKKKFLFERFNLSRERDINVFSDNCSPDSEAEIIMCVRPSTLSTSNSFT